MEDSGTIANWGSFIAAVIAIIVSVWLYRRGRKKKTLACEFLSVESPIEIRSGDALDGAIEIRYKGQIVDNLFIVRAILKNTGNTAIQESDVIDPVTFNFEEGELLRPPKILDKKPSNLKFRWKFEPDPVGTGVKPSIAKLEFRLFNPGAEMTVEFLCAGESQLPKVGALIEGVSEIELLEREKVLRKTERRSQAIMIFSWVIAIALIALSAWFFPEDSLWPNAMAMFAIFMVALVSLVLKRIRERQILVR